MKIIRTIQTAAIVTVAAISLYSVNANACGLIGCIVNQVAPGAGDVLDDMNEELGQPTEFFGERVVDNFAPGAGAALTARRMGQNRGGNSGDGAMGNRCQTNFGVSFPGPWNPLGSFCSVGGDPGRIVR